MQSSGSSKLSMMLEDKLLLLSEDWDNFRDEGHLGNWEMLLGIFGVFSRREAILLPDPSNCTMYDYIEKNQNSDPCINYTIEPPSVTPNPATISCIVRPYFKPQSLRDYGTSP